MIPVTDAPLTDTMIEMLNRLASREMKGAARKVRSVSTKTKRSTARRSN